MVKVIYKIENKPNRYFLENYNMVWTNVGREGQETIPLDDKNSTCRFCGRTNEETKFSNKCHAVPEFFGNKTSITRNECDECNHKYADLLEDDLAKLTLSTRTMTGVYGKKGIPKYKDVKTNNTCEYKEGIYQINSYNDFFEIDEENKKVKLKFKTQTMVPLKAYKALVRIALNCLPKEYFDKFKIVRWLESEKDLGGSTNFYTKVITRFVPKISPMFVVCLFIRKENIENVPYCQMVLQSNNMFYQVIIPFIDEDRYLQDIENVIIEPFSFGVEGVDEGKISVIDLASNEKQSTIQTCVLNYDRKELINEEETQIKEEYAND